MKALVELEQLSQKEQEAINSFLHKLEKRYTERILSVRLFGSRARGEARPDSDVDIAVIVDQDDPELRRSIRFLAVDVWLEHGLYISTRVWSLPHWNQLKNIRTGLYLNLEREGVELHSSVRRTGG